MSRRYLVAMAHEHLERSVTRRPWTRPTLRRLSSGGQAEGEPTIPLEVEFTDTNAGRPYYFGPAPS